VGWRGGLRGGKDGPARPCCRGCPLRSHCRAAHSQAAGAPSPPNCKAQRCSAQPPLAPGPWPRPRLAFSRYMRLPVTSKSANLVAIIDSCRSSVVMLWQEGRRGAAGRGAAGGGSWCWAAAARTRARARRYRAAAAPSARRSRVELPHGDFRLEDLGPEEVLVCVADAAVVPGRARCPRRAAAALLQRRRGARRARAAPRRRRRRGVPPLRAASEDAGVRRTASLQRVHGGGGRACALRGWGSRVEGVEEWELLLVWGARIDVGNAVERSGAPQLAPRRAPRRRWRQRGQRARWRRAVRPPAPRQQRHRARPASLRGAGVLRRSAPPHCGLNDPGPLHAAPAPTPHRPHAPRIRPSAVAAPPLLPVQRAARRAGRAPAPRARAGAGAGQRRQARASPARRRTAAPAATRTRRRAARAGRRAAAGTAGVIGGGRQGAGLRRPQPPGRGPARPSPLSHGPRQAVRPAAGARCRTCAPRPPRPRPRSCMPGGPFHVAGPRGDGRAAAGAGRSRFTARPVDAPRCHRPVTARPPSAPAFSPNAGQAIAVGALPGWRGQRDAQGTRHIRSCPDRRRRATRSGGARSADPPPSHPSPAPRSTLRHIPFRFAVSQPRAAVSSRVKPATDPPAPRRGCTAGSGRPGASY
jgi:hypothetical protein